METILATLILMCSNYYGVIMTKQFQACVERVVVCCERTPGPYNQARACTKEINK